MRRILPWVLVLTSVLVLAGAGASLWYLMPRPVGDLTATDYEMITNAVTGRVFSNSVVGMVEYEVLEIIPREDVVVVNMGIRGVCWYCYILKRTPSGWRIHWEGS